MVTHQIPGDAAMTGKRTRDFDENDVHPGNAKPAEGESRKKRSRGRPRLDTKDETAADVSVIPAQLAIWAMCLGRLELVLTTSRSVGVHKSVLLKERTAIARIPLLPC
jgi:hypothetical protein